MMEMAATPDPSTNPADDANKKSFSMLKWRLILGKKAEKQNLSFNNIPQNVMDQILNQSPNNKPKPKQPKTGSVGNKSIPVHTGKKPGSSPSPSSGSKHPPGRVGMKPGQSSGIKGGSGGAKSGKNQANQAKMMLQQIDQSIDFVYNPKGKSRRAGGSGSGISIPVWLKNVKNLFPQQAREILERDLVKKSKIEDIIKHPELFDKVEPNLEMLGLIMRMKHLLPAAIREKAKQLVDRVVQQLIKKLRKKFKRAIIGALNRNMHTPVHCFRNIDWKQTITKNLKNYNQEMGKIILQDARFFSRQKKRKHWRIIIMIDESGSMAESIIYSAVIASIFHELPAISTNLIIFDTEVVDLSEKAGHPVEVLMSTTLSGGTNITKALRYGQTLATNHKRTLYILITDFYEGGGYANLTREIIRIRESGAQMIGIAALGRNAEPMYDRNYANQVKKMGFDVISCTPEALAPVVAKILEN